MQTQTPFTQIHDDVVTDIRKTYIVFTAAILAGLGIVAVVVAVLRALSSDTPLEPLDFAGAILVIVGLVVPTLVRSGRYYIATPLLIGSIVFLYAFPNRPEAAVIIASAALVTGAILLVETRIFIVLILLLLARPALAMWDRISTDGFVEGFQEPGLWVMEFVLILFLGGTLRVYVLAAERAAARARRNANLIQTTAQIGETTTRLLDTTEVFERAVRLIRDRFGHYHVQVFLVDEERKYANLVASTGSIGRQLLNRGHRLAVGSQSVIGQVTQNGEIVIARDTDGDNVHARNELLPATRSEMALPIIDGETIIGALDVQSYHSDAFDDDDIQALEIVANQLATAARNARLFEQQAENVQQNKRLFFEAEANLAEIKRLNQQLTRQSWQDYLSQRERVTGVTLTPDGVTVGADWSTHMVEASRRRNTITRSGEEQAVAVPIMLRGEVIGAIEIDPGSSTHIPDVIETVQSIAQRLAVSLDNARLFEETQAASAQQEHINAIVGHYQEAVSINELLEITLAELSTSLGAERGSIRLGQLEAGSPDAGANGHSNGTQSNGHTPDGGNV